MSKKDVFNIIQVEKDQVNIEESKGAKIWISENVLLNEKNIGKVRNIPISMSESGKMYGWIHLESDDSFKKVEFIDKSFVFEEGKPNTYVDIYYYCYDKNTKVLNISCK